MQQFVVVLSFLLFVFVFLCLCVYVKGLFFVCFVFNAVPTSLCCAALVVMNNMDQRSKKTTSVCALCQKQTQGIAKQRAVLKTLLRRAL